MVRVVAQVTPNERNSRRQTGWEVAATPARLQPGGTRSHKYDLASRVRWGCTSKRSSASWPDGGFGGVSTTISSCVLLRQSSASAGKHHSNFTY